MPTGYTADIAKGITFQQYAMTCARAFGALIMMRDDPADAAIPEKFEPSAYYAKSLKEAQARVAELGAMTPAQVDAAADKDYDTAMARWHKGNAESAALRQKYETMLAAVDAWQPPTANHIELKKFMSEQIRSSIEFDCRDSHDDKPVKVSPTEWYLAEQKEAMRHLGYAAEENAKEVARAADRTTWVAALRASLNPAA